MKPLDMQSDAFKFHVRKICALGLAEKTTDGAYQLTPKGKEFANKLSRSAKQPRQQPKVSVLVIARRQNANNETEYLCQRRLRQPFYGFWSGCIGGPILWGESYEEAANRELRKQTGLQASDFRVALFCRQRDIAQDTEAILEDKLFVIVETTRMQGDLNNSWKGGHNEWLTLAQLAGKPQTFRTFDAILEALARNQQHISIDTHYSNSLY